MKHRAVGIFIILLASLAAVPQASQEFKAFKAAVGERVRVEIWNAFLSLHGRGRRRSAAAAAPLPVVANCEGEPQENTEPVWRAGAAKSDPAHTAHGTRKTGSDIARIVTDPTLDPRTFSAAWHLAESPAVLNHVLSKVSRVDLVRGGELAIIVPPDTGFAFETLSTAAPQLRAGERAVRARRVEVAGLKKENRPEVARARRERQEIRLEAQKMRDEVRRQIIEDANAVGGDKGKPAESYFKFLKVKALNKVSAPLAWSMPSGKEVSCQSSTLPAQSAPAPPAGE